MDIQELNYILTLAELRNFTSAAQACGLSQSALSKHLAKLESELGNVTLFDRSKRPIILTAAGEEFIQYARQICRDYEDLCLSMRKYSRLGRNILRVGVIPVMGRFGFSHLIKDFKTTLSAQETLEIIDRPSKELLKLLEKEEIDLALLATSSSQALKTNLTRYPLMKNELCLIVNDKHRFALRSSVDLREMTTERFAIPDNETGMYDLCISACRAAGAQLENVKTYRNIETILDLVEEGESVSLLTARLLSTYNRPNLRPIHLSCPVQSIIALVMQNTSQFNDLAQRFVDFSRNKLPLLQEKEF